MNINFKQMLAIIITTLSVLAISSANLTELFGSQAAKLITSGANLMTAIFGGWMTIISGQGTLVAEVSNMKGVEPIKINAQANPTLAALATDPNQSNIGGTTPQVQAVLQDIAKG